MDGSTSATAAPGCRRASEGGLTPLPVPAVGRGLVPAEDFRYVLGPTQPIGLTFQDANRVPHLLASTPPEGATPTDGNHGGVLWRCANDLADPRTHQLATDLPMGRNTENTSEALGAFGGRRAAFMQRHILACRVWFMARSQRPSQTEHSRQALLRRFRSPGYVEENRTCCLAQLPQTRREGDPAECGHKHARASEENTQRKRERERESDTKDAGDTWPLSPAVRLPQP